MHAAFDQFFSFVAIERTGHAKRLRFAGLMCILILVLLYQTQWTNLRPGLVILLVGQAGVALALFFRNSQLMRMLDLQKSETLPEQSIAGWFETESSFLRRLAWFESACQIAGFFLLGYEFWLASRNVWIALAIGVVYPAAMYFGMNRRRNVKAIRELMAKKRQIAAIS